MTIIGYIGNHSNDALSARLGWALVRLAQVGDKYRRVTHCEVLFSGSPSEATIGGASVRDGGVRIKQTSLSHGSWVVLDVPAWDRSKAWEFIASQGGMKYDWRGALATVLWLLPNSKAAWFCSEIMAFSVGLIDAHRYKPSTLFALAESLPGTRNITEEFFKGP
jgi:hypothetical protein